jgi:5'-3' exoribonuclease 1
MGVPGFFGWLLKQYKEHKMLCNKLDNISTLYIDANCLIHPQCRIVADYCKDIYDMERLEKKMFQRISNYLDFLLAYANPQDEFFIAIDGSAPLAKINQQRKRRIRTLDDTKIRNEIKKKHKIEINNTWDSTRITPGTTFMSRLHDHLLYYINELSKKRPNIKITYSSFYTSGEGEHKILEDIRFKQKNDSSFNDKNISIYGLDADLIFLAMASQKNNVYLLRESVQFSGKSIPNEIYDILTDVAEEMTYLSIDNMKECYVNQIINIINNRIETGLFEGKTQIEYTYDKLKLFSNDFVLLCYFLGNDFLPHLPSIDIKRNGLDILIDAYVDVYLTINMHLMNDKLEINQYMFMEIIRLLGEKEEEYFTKIKPSFDNKFNRRQCPVQDPYQKELWLLDNLKNIKIDDPVQLGVGNKDIWKYRYYEHYFNTSEYQNMMINKLCENFIEGIIWTTKYYFEGCPSWMWQYKYSHSPFLSDIYQYLSNNNINLDNIQFIKDKPLNPCVQLLAVLPSGCSMELPFKYRTLVKSSDSPIIDMYPTKVKLDLINKDLLWQAIPFMPYLNIQRIIKAIDSIELTKDEQKRNMLLDNFVIN